MINTRFILFLLVVCFFTAIGAQGQDLSAFEKRVTAFTLDNGMKFILVERHEAPVVSFMTIADVGSINEKKGITGLAHLFEHMAFKGTRTIGAKDIEKELEAMKKEDDAFRKLKVAERAIPPVDAKVVENLRKELDEAVNEARKWVVNNEFAEAIEKAGGVGLNAFTSYDFTGYTSSLPSNKIELWFAMESDRFLNPCLREFYTEKNVVMEERRMGIENRPRGKLMEEFGCLAFLAHPYGEPLIGHMSDLQNLPRGKAEAFFKEYYVAPNLMAVIVGDIDPAKARQLAQTYFGRLPRVAKPELNFPAEPPQRGERRVTLDLDSQPFVLFGYHVPEFLHPSNVPFTVLTDVLSGGRSSRLYQKLVKDKKIAISAGCNGGYPGSRYPNLFVFSATPAQGHTNEECEAAILEEIEVLKTTLITPEELAKAKIRARKGLVASLESNEGIAFVIGYYQLVAGDWREFFHRGLEKIGKVSAQDVQDLAKTWFTPENRSIGLIRTAKKPAKAGASGATGGNAREPLVPSGVGAASQPALATSPAQAR